MIHNCASSDGFLLEHLLHNISSSHRCRLDLMLFQTFLTRQILAVLGLINDQFIFFTFVCFLIRGNLHTEFLHHLHIAKIFHIAQLQIFHCNSLWLQTFCFSTISLHCPCFLHIFNLHHLLLLSHLSFQPFHLFPQRSHLLSQRSHLFTCLHLFFLKLSHLSTSNDQLLQDCLSARASLKLLLAQL